MPKQSYVLHCPSLDWALVAELLVMQTSTVQCLFKPFNCSADIHYDCMFTSVLKMTKCYRIYSQIGRNFFLIFFFFKYGCDLSARHTFKVFGYCKYGTLFSS